MTTIPSYPPPASATLDGSELVLGFANGKTVRINAGMIAALALAQLQGSATISYDPATGSISLAPANVTAAISAWLDALPTDAPAPSGSWWNNGGIPTRTS